MIHKLLHLERPLIIFDVETTGLKVEEDRIVELGFQLFTDEGLQKEWRGLVNPGRPIPEHITKVHGISDSTIADEPTFDHFATSLAKGFSNCDFGGKNIRFDLKILAEEMKRNKVEWSYAKARIIDIDRLEQLGEPRHLSALYKKYTGKELIGAHTALADVAASVEIIEEQLQKYQSLPRSLDKLHNEQWPGWIDTEGKFKFKNGMPCITFGAHRDKPMKDVPQSYWKWISKSGFSDEIRLLAEEALLGKYPEVFND